MKPIAAIGHRAGYRLFAKRKRIPTIGTLETRSHQLQRANHVARIVAQCGPDIPFEGIATQIPKAIDPHLERFVAPDFRAGGHQSRIHAELIQAVIGQSFRLYAGDDCLSPVESAVAATGTLSRRGQIGKHEVAVRHTAPAPVDVKQAIGIVAIAHKGMASLRTGTAVIDGTLLVQLVANDGIPFGLGIVEPVLQLHIPVVAEIGSQCLGHILRKGATLVAVIHTHRDSAVIHQGSHGISLLVGTLAGIDGRYMVPVVIGILDILFVYHQALASRSIPRDCAGSLLGPLVVSHNLSHGRSHTSHDGLSAIAHHRTLPIVGVALVPQDTAQQRSHRLARGLRGTLDRLSGEGDGLGCRSKRLELGCVRVQQIPEVVGQAVDVERSGIGIPQNLGGPVVGRHDDKTLPPVKDIEQRLRIPAAGIGELRRGPHRLFKIAGTACKFAGYLLCLLHGARPGIQRCSQRHTQSHYKKWFHSIVFHFRHLYYCFCNMARHIPFLWRL